MRIGYTANGCSFFVCIGEGNGMDKKDYIGTDVLRRALEDI